MPITEFTRSPLNEVVCGVEFSSLEFSSVHFGLYWQTIKDRFPHPPLDRAPIGVIDLSSILSMPNLRRVWFESEDKKRLIQLQSNRFHYNWRLQDKADQYPHFNEIYSRFADEWKKLQDWWENTEKSILQPSRYELTYVNQIDKNFGWNSTIDDSNIFSFINKNLSDMPLKPQILNANLEFTLEENAGNLSVRIDQAINPNDEMPVIVLNLTASTIDVSRNMTEWFDLAHTQTVKTFLSLITHESKEQWGFRCLD